VTDDLIKRLCDPGIDQFGLDVAAVEAAQEIKTLRAALSELVTLNNTAASLPAWPLFPDPDIETRRDLDRRQPLAWIAARKALGLQP
jgi:hypothetical protein